MPSGLKSRNRRLAVVSFGVAAAMVGAAFGAVPLYQVFCRVTGYAGTTQVADTLPTTVLNRKIQVRFNADVDPALPWKFEPAQDRVEARIGEPMLAFYRAQNLSDRAILGTAVFNVVPMKAGRYFNKVACFCFSEQRLEAGASADMPVSFFVDPAIADDRNLDDVHTITLSYTFYRSEAEADRSARADEASPETDG